MFCAHTWSSISWSLNIFLFTIDEKSWIHIDFTTFWNREHLCFFLFLLFHFLSWAIFKHHKFSLCVPIIRDRHDLHLHDLSSHFLSPTTKFLISYCSLQHFYALGTSKITVFFDFFTCSRSEFLNHELSFDFPIIIVHTWSSFSRRLKDRKTKKRKKKQRENVARCGFWISLVFIRFSYIIVPHQIYIKKMMSMKDATCKNFMFYEKKCIGAQKLCRNTPFQ